ncbi:Neuronal cell adhesion molecule, partial [Stegodyphus mimosarum]
MTKVKPIKFQWLKNDKDLGEFQENIRINLASEVSVLILDPVKSEDSGNYTCIATNSHGSDKFVANLNVKASPKWIQQPADVVTNLGATAMAYCLASGSPKPEITWSKLFEGKISLVKSSQGAT